MYGKFMKFLYHSGQKLGRVGIRYAHSCPDKIEMTDMYVSVLPALKDNYMYLIVDTCTKQAALVDCSDADIALKAVKDEKVILKTILATHYHWDHTRGIDKLVEMIPVPKLEVLGASGRIPAITRCVKHCDKFKIGKLCGKCIFTPCHTTDSMCYYVESPCGEKVIFTGDTLFQAGCGQFFEGTAAQMYSALYEKLGCIPEETKVFFGHELTIPNLCYAQQVEPENEDVLERLEWAKSRRDEKLPTVPSTICKEKLWNPFMRVHEPTVQKHAEKSTPIDTMRVLHKERYKSELSIKR